MAEASVHVARTSGLFKPRLRRGCLPSSVYHLPFTVLPSIVLIVGPKLFIEPGRSNDASSHLGTSRWVEARFERALVLWKHT
jgi:hypothetical protein